MGKKKAGKKSKKGKKGKKEEVPEEPIPALSPEEWPMFLRQQREQLGAIQDERSYFQLERDQLESLVQIERQQRADMEARIRLLEKQKEDAELRHQVEIKVYQQKVKHLQYEHSNTVEAIKHEGDEKLQRQESAHAERSETLKRDKRNYKMELKELQLRHEEEIKALQAEQEKNLAKIRETNAKELELLREKYDQRLLNLQEDLDLRQRMEIHEIEERKNTHINALVDKHQAAFREIKAYYNEIVRNNVKHIHSLQEEIAALERKDQENKQLMFEIAEENKRLSKPLEDVLKEVTRLKLDLENYDKDKLTLRHTKARLLQAESQLRAMQYEHEQLEKQFVVVQRERDELLATFERTLGEVQERAGLKNVVLERKVAALTETATAREAQLSRVLAESNLDPEMLGEVTMKLEMVLENKNRTIRQLQYELARVTKAHNDVIRTYEVKLREMGVPIDDIMDAIKPVDTAAGAGPAGLVAQ